MCVPLWSVVSLKIVARHCATQIDVQVTPSCPLMFHFSSKQEHVREHWPALHAI